MCDYRADRYEERSPSERSCLEAPLEKEGIGLLGELPRNGGDAVLLHTDLHAGNVLAAEREPWLAIDPKPCVADPACDATQHIFNGVFVEGADAGALASPMARLLDLESRPDLALALCPGCRGVAVPGGNGRPGPDPLLPPDLSSMQRRTRR